MPRVASPLEIPVRAPAIPIDGPSIWDVLTAWRAAERELARLDDQDADWHRVHANVAGLRALHHRLFVARLDADSTAVDPPQLTPV